VAGGGISAIVISGFEAIEELDAQMTHLSAHSGTALQFSVSI